MKGRLAIEEGCCSGCKGGGHWTDRSRECGREQVSRKTVGDGPEAICRDPGQNYVTTVRSRDDMRPKGQLCSAWREHLHPEEGRT